MAGPAVGQPSRPRVEINGRNVDPRARFVFLGVLALWCLFPVLLQGNLAQDALPYVVAGQLVTEAPDQIYATKASDLYDLPPKFAQRSCELAPTGTDCASFAVAFVSSPPSLVMAWLMGLLGAPIGVFLARFLAALSLAVGMVLVWNRLTRPLPVAAPYLAASALLFTPFATVPITLGQTSPYLFLSICLGWEHARTPLRKVLTAGLFSLTCLLKVFPAIAGLVLLVRRRWGLVGLVAAWATVLAVIAAMLGPLAWYTEFLTTSKLMAEFSLVNPYNGAVAAMAHKISPSFTTGVVYAVLLAATAMLLGACWWWRVRWASLDGQWAFGVLASLFFVPLVWWHYLWVGVGAVAMFLATSVERSGKEPMFAGRSALLVLPLMAAISIPISIPNGTGSAVPWAQFLFLGACLAATVALAPAATPPASPKRERVIVS